MCITVISGLDISLSPLLVLYKTQVSLIVDGVKLFNLSLDVLVVTIEFLGFPQLCPSLAEVSVHYANLRCHRKEFCVYPRIMVPRNFKWELFPIVSMIKVIERPVYSL